MPFYQSLPLDSRIWATARCCLTPSFFDGLNITSICDADADVLERYGYDAFGTTLFMTASFAPLSESAYDWETTFCGYRLDSETGFYQVRYRYLHPTLGRWLSRDPLDGGVRLTPRVPGMNQDFEATYLLSSDRPVEMLLGPNLYEYVDNTPLNGTDPSGLEMVPRLIFPPTCDQLINMYNAEDTVNVNLLAQMDQLAKKKKAAGCKNYSMANSDDPTMQNLYKQWQASVNDQNNLRNLMIQNGCAFGP
jgi:RHS repeat-associated protein